MGYMSDSNSIGVNLSPNQFKGNDGKLYAIVACVLENDGAGSWRQIAGAHKSINVTSIDTSGSTIKVNYSFTAKNVVSFIAAPDDVFAGQGYNFGSSVGLSQSIIVMGRTTQQLGGYVSYNGSAWAKSGQGITSSAFAANVLTITHDSIPGLQVTCHVRNGVYDIHPLSMSDTTSQFRFKDPVTNAFITAADTSMLVYFTRSYGAYAVDPATVNIASANIWCYGVFEI